MPGRSRLAVATVSLALLAACAPGPARPSAAAPRATVAPVTPPADPLGGCPTAVSFSSLSVVARLPGADDVATAPDGSIWVSDARSVLEHRTAAGALVQHLLDPRVPEGMVVLSDGSLLLAEQGPDRVVQLTPSTSNVRTVLQLTPRGGVLGVDGVGYVPQTGTVLVPDSPNGTLLAVPLEAGTPTRLAAGLGRPVGVAALGDGSFAVAAENPSGLYRVPAGGGAATPLGDVTQADDVVAAGTLLYVTSLTTHQLIAVDPRSGRTHVLVTGDSMPQGLAQLPDGDLVLTDSSSGVVARVHSCGVRMTG